MHKFRNSSTEDSNPSFLDCILPLSYHAQYIPAFMVSKDVSLIASSLYLCPTLHNTDSDNPPILSEAPYIQQLTTYISASTCVNLFYLECHFKQLWCDQSCVTCPAWPNDM